MSRLAGRWVAAVSLAAVLLAGCTGPAASGPDVNSTSSAPFSEPTPAPTVVSSVASSVAFTATEQGVRIEALPFPEPAGGELPAAQQAALQAGLEELTEPFLTGVIDGVTVAVVTPNGSWTSAIGTDEDEVPLVPSAIADIASITKTVTAAEVVSLAQAGVIDLEAPATIYLEHPLLDRDPTIRQLLSHTSGVPDSFSDRFFTAVGADPARTWTPADTLAYATGPITEPGRPVMEYSNSNYLLLGLIIEKITGLSYAKALRRDVLADLGSRMVVQTEEHPSPPLAAPDNSDSVFPDGQFVPNRAVASATGAAGGIAADAPTLATWGYRLYGGLIVDPEGTVDLTTPVVPGYGLGTAIISGLAGPDLVVGHGGLIPGYSTLLIVDPTRQVSVAILTVGSRGPVLNDLLATEFLTTLST